MFKFSYLQPYYIRTNLMVFSLTFQFGLNVLLTMDDFIDMRAQDTEHQNDYFYTLSKEPAKIFRCIFIGCFVEGILRFLVYVPQKLKEQVFEKISSKDVIEAGKGRQLLYKGMWFRYVLFFIITIAISIFFWIYIMNFAGIYPMTTYTCFMDASICILFKWFVFAFFIGLISSCFSSPGCCKKTWFVLETFLA
jgi:hypothetical protein